MNHKNRLSGVLLPTLLLTALLSACDNRQEQAQTAYAEYQSALVSGDLRAARRALGTLVAADDSNADYWVELGKVSIQLSDFGAAYDAFQRAHELNRGNVEVLAIMTELALRAGNLEVASDNARQLELLAPSNPAVPLTKGYVALRRGDYDEADRQVAALLAAAPYNTSATVLKSRIMLSRGQDDEAIKLLSSQISQQPSDAASLKALAGIYEIHEDWGKAADALNKYLAWQPTDQEARIRLVEANLRSKQTDAASSLTLKAIEKDDVDNLLAPWIEVGQQNALADSLFEWAKEANVGRRIAVARFLLSTEQPARAVALVEPSATLPVRAENLIPNAIYGAALIQSGRAQEGLSRIDAALKVDGNNREALQARAMLRSRMGSHKQAIEDAQKLVAADQNSAPSRLLLARIYVASGDLDGAKRALWDAFHDLGDDRTIFDALQPLVARTDGADAAKRLSQEFYDKRSEQLTRSFA